MISLGVENSRNDNIPALNPIEKLARETPRYYPTETAIVMRVTFGRPFEQTENPANLVKEFIAQRSPLRFVPPGGSRQIRLGLRAYNNAPTHERICRRKRGSTSFHSAPAEGLA
jgi:hypothetical protein